MGVALCVRAAQQVQLARGGRQWQGDAPLTAATNQTSISYSAEPKERGPIEMLHPSLLSIPADNPRFCLGRPLSMLASPDSLPSPAADTPFRR